MTPTEEAQRLCLESIVVDLHIDPIIQHFVFGYDLRREHGPEWRPRRRRGVFRLLKLYARLRRLHRPFFNHIDLPRLRKGHYTAGGFGIHAWPVQSERGWRLVRKQLHYFRSVVHENDRILQARTPRDVRTAFRTRKLAGFPGVEGAHCLGGTSITKRIDRLVDLFENFGVRYLTLAHFSKNDFATPSMGLGRGDEGLSEHGKELIRKMNDLGMIVDVAHVCHLGVLDACRVSRKPVVVTHTGLQAVNRHPRNITDDALRAVADTGGVVGVMFAPNFLSGTKENPTSEIVVRHLEHIVSTVGEDHAALGSDFDGWIPRIPEDMQDATSLPILVQRMLEAGFGRALVRKILGENFLRVWEAVLAD